MAEQAKPLIRAGLYKSYADNIPVLRDIDAAGLEDVKFGREFKEKEFMLRKGTVFFNHGSYGAVPRKVFDVQLKYMYELEEHADMFFRINVKYYIDETRREIAEFIGADMENVFMVSNVTTCLNTSIKSYPFKAGEAILIINWSYGSIKLLCEDFVKRLRTDVECIDLKFSFLSEDDVVNKYEEALQKYPNIKVAIIDHITSGTATVMPVKRITDLCHKYGVLAFIDGAHCIGQVPLNLNDLGADIYTSNLHKWCYTPRGSSFLWCAPEHSQWLHPTNTSWNIGQGKDLEFLDQGTRDLIPLICARNGLQFYKAIGGMNKILQHTTGLANKAQELMETELSLKHLAIPKSMEAPNMRIVLLPPFKNYPCTTEGIAQLMPDLFGPSNIFGILIKLDDEIGFRYSLQVYNEMDDVLKVIELLKSFISKHAS